MTFEELTALCEKAGEPFQALVRKADGSYQASLRSSYDPTKAFVCDTGSTPVEALKAVMRQRRIIDAVKISAADLL